MGGDDEAPPVVDFASTAAMRDLKPGLTVCMILPIWRAPRAEQAGRVDGRLQLDAALTNKVLEWLERFSACIRPSASIAAMRSSWSESASVASSDLTTFRSPGSAMAPSTLRAASAHVARFAVGDNVQQSAQRFIRHRCHLTSNSAAPS